MAKRSRSFTSTDIDLAYPILTEEVEAGGGPSGAVAPSALSTTARNTVRDVLGWRPKPGDAKGFLAALTGSFETEEVEGHTEVTWRPRAMAVQADLGAVTGAQASIYGRARAELDQLLPLLDSLTPLTPSPDLEDSEAFRVIVRAELVALVDELGVPGGPRSPRVDAFFNALTGVHPREHRSRLISAEDVGGQLGRLRDLLGLIPNNINTVSEEQAFTKFLIVVDIVAALASSWGTHRDLFNPALRGGGYFGTDLVLLSRYLAAVAESVDELRFACDSVFLGRSERETIVLPGAPVTLAGLMDWIRDYATVEGTQAITDGGKDGVTTAFVPTMRELHRLVRRHLVMAVADGDHMISLKRIRANDLPPAFFTARVQLAALQLSAYLREVLERASRIQRFPDPIIVGVDPEIILTGGPATTIVATGLGFAAGHSLRLTFRTGQVTEPPSVRLPKQGTVQIDEGRIQAIFDTEDMAAGEWEVSLVDSHGQEVAEGPSLYRLEDDFQVSSDVK
jgi:hypothetical protein